MKDADKKTEKSQGSFKNLTKNLTKNTFSWNIISFKKSQEPCILMLVSQTVPDSLNQLEGYFKVNLIFYCYLMTTWQMGRSA